MNILSYRLTSLKTESKKQFSKIIYDYFKPCFGIQMLTLQDECLMLLNGILSWWFITCLFNIESL